MTATELDRRTFLAGLAALALVGARPGGGGGQHRSAAPQPIGAPAMALPDQVVAGYWPYWEAPPLTKLDAGYNTIYLFHAEPVGGPPGTTGAVRWKGPTDPPFVAQLAGWRAEGGRALLTVGGENAQIVLDSPRRTAAFLASVRGIHRDLGGFDGLDWNNYEAMDDPPTTEMIRASLELKAQFGPDFSITTPPAPWSTTDMAHCRAMLDAGVLDLVAPQFYGAPGLDSPRFIADSMRTWSAVLGNPAVLAVGLKVGAQPGGMDGPRALRAWEHAVRAVPRLRGAFSWHVGADALASWEFARVVGPHIARGLVGPSRTGPDLLPLLGLPKLSPGERGAHGSAPAAPTDRAPEPAEVREGR